MYLLVLILYSSSAFYSCHIIGICSSKKDSEPFLALTLNMWQASWMLKIISKMTFKSRKSWNFVVSDTDLQSLHYYFHWLHIWFVSPSMNEVVISNTAGIVILPWRRSTEIGVDIWKLSFGKIKFVSKEESWRRILCIKTNGIESEKFGCFRMQNLRWLCIIS